MIWFLQKLFSKSKIFCWAKLNSSIGFNLLTLFWIMGLHVWTKMWCRCVRNWRNYWPSHIAARICFISVWQKQLYPPLPSEFVDWKLKAQADVSFCKQVTRAYSKRGAWLALLTTSQRATQSVLTPRRNLKAYWESDNPTEVVQVKKKLTPLRVLRTLHLGRRRCPSACCVSLPPVIVIVIVIVIIPQLGQKYRTLLRQRWDYPLASKK